MANNGDDPQNRPKPRGRYRRYDEPGHEHLLVPRQTLFSQRQRIQAVNQQPADQVLMEQDHVIVAQDQMDVEQVDVEVHDLGAHLHRVQPAVDGPETLNADVALDGMENEVPEVCVGVCICGQCELEADEDGNHVPDVEQAIPPAEPSCYKDRFNWNESIAPGIATTKFEAFLLVLHMAMRHGMTGPLIEDQLKFVNALLGSNVIPPSNFIFKRLFTPKAALQFHFYCPSCELYLGEKASFGNDTLFVACEVCQHDCNVHDLSDGNGFITLSVRDQIEELLLRPDVRLISRSDRENRTIHDMMDGSMYRDLCKDGDLLSDPNSLSITINTDGAKVYNSGKGSLWPVQFILNELDPNQRLRVENVGLLALWFGKGSPNMSVFLTPFVKEMQDLAVNGIRKHLPDGTVVKCPVVSVVCCVDSVAKPKLAGMKLFNGRNACGYCYHPNTQIVDPKSNKKTRRYTAVEYPYRTHTEMVEDMLTADLLEKEGLLKKFNVGKENEIWDDVNGLKGISPMLELPGFNVVFSFIIDYMHHLKNVMDKLYELLFLAKSKGNDYWLSADKQDLVNHRLQAITPPQSMSRRPRSLKDYRDWKAIECRSFILYYILPCLDDLLPHRYLNNLKDLVSGYQILLQESISPGELLEADRNLQNFVRNFNALYGDIHMTYNIHLTTHLAHIVSLWGPLWAYSAFPFESGNGHLIKLVKGTTGVVTQIAQKYATVQAVPLYVKDYDVSQRIMDICSSICSYSRLKYCVQLDSSVTAFGQDVTCRATDEERSAMSNVAGMPILDHVSYFNRVVCHKTLYYSSAYDKPNRFNDTCVSLKNGLYAVIHKLILRPDTEEMFAFVYPLRLCESDVHLAPHIKTCAFHAYAPMCLIPFSDILTKCCLVEVGQRKFVCLIPNHYERD